MAWETKQANRQTLPASQFNAEVAEERSLIWREQGGTHLHSQPPTGGQLDRDATSRVISRWKEERIWLAIWNKNGRPYTDWPSISAIAAMPSSRRRNAQRVAAAARPFNRFTYELRVQLRKLGDSHDRDDVGDRAYSAARKIYQSRQIWDDGWSTYPGSVWKHERNTVPPNQNPRQRRYSIRSGRQNFRSETLELRATDCSAALLQCTSIRPDTKRSKTGRGEDKDKPKHIR